MAPSATIPEPPPLRLSLVIPCYNEVGNIRRGVLDALGAFAEADDRFGEVLVVDDGSTFEALADIVRIAYFARTQQYTRA